MNTDSHQSSSDIGKGNRIMLRRSTYNDSNEPETVSDRIQMSYRNSSPAKVSRRPFVQKGSVYIKRICSNSSQAPKVSNINKTIKLKVSSDKQPDCVINAKFKRGLINNNKLKLGPVVKQKTFPKHIPSVRKSAVLSPRTSVSSSNIASSAAIKSTETPQVNLDKIPNYYTRKDFASTSSQQMVPPVQKKKPLLPTPGQKLLETCELMDVDNIKTEASAAASTLWNTERPSKICFVVDTSAIIHDLDVFEEVLNAEFKDYGLPIFIIPYIVIVELDKLKDSKTKGEALQIKVRRTVRKIQKLFSEGHPRVISQKNMLMKDRKHDPDLCNDDLIIKCCIEYKEIMPSHKLFIFTNDNNMSTKAILNGISTVSTETIHSKINKSSKTVVKISQKVLPSEENHSILLDQETDQIVCEMKTELKVTLTIVANHECNEIYGENLWKRYKKKRLQGSLLQTVNLINQNWNAGFSDRTPYRLPVFKQLRNYITSDFKRLSTNIDKPRKIMLDLIDVFTQWDNSVGYYNQLKHCILVLRKLVKRCDKIIRRMSNKRNVSASDSESDMEYDMMPLKTKNNSPLTSNGDDSSISSSSNCFQNVSLMKSDAKIPNKSFIPMSAKSLIPPTATEDQKIEGYLEIVWKYCHTCCGQILDGLNIPNQWKHERLQCLPSFNEICQFLPVFYTNLQSLRHHAKKIAENPNNPNIIDCVAFLKAMTDMTSNNNYMNKCKSSDINEDFLMSYFCQANNRKELNNGLLQLAMYRSTLLECMIEISNRMNAQKSEF